MKTSMLISPAMGIFGALLAILTVVPNCWALNVYFNGSTSSDFLTATNWSPAGVPGNNLFDVVRYRRRTHVDVAQRQPDRQRHCEWDRSTKPTALVRTTTANW